MLCGYKTIVLRNCTTKASCQRKTFALTTSCRNPSGMSVQTVGGIAASFTAHTAMMQTLLFQIFKRSETDTLLELAYLRRLDIRNAQEKALAKGRRLKHNRDEHMQIRYAIEVLYDSWASTEPLPPGTIFQFRFPLKPSAQQWNWRRPGINN